MIFRGQKIASKYVKPEVAGQLVNLQLGLRTLTPLPPSKEQNYQRKSARAEDPQAQPAGSRTRAPPPQQPRNTHLQMPVGNSPRQATLETSHRDVI